MKVKFNKFERVAGLFVGIAIIGALTFTVAVAIKKGWFSAKVKYQTMFESAEGLHTGTKVNVAGVRAGSVESVELISANEVRIELYILQKFQKRVREDSLVMAVRPFIIGEKILDISVGSEDSKILQNEGFLQSTVSFDVMDLMSGRKLGPMMDSLTGVFDNLKTLLVAFSDPERTRAFVKMFDQLTPLLSNLNIMSKDAVSLMGDLRKGGSFIKLINGLALLTKELNAVIPDIHKETPRIGLQLGKLVRNLSVLISKMTPMVSEVGADLPRAARRAIEALDEAVVLLKAMQKSFLISGKVDDVRSEEKLRDQKRVEAGENPLRQPAKEKSKEQDKKK